MRYLVSKGEVIATGTFDEIKPVGDSMIREGRGFTIYSKSGRDFLYHSTYWKSSLDDNGKMSARHAEPPFLVDDKNIIKKLLAAT